MSKLGNLASAGLTAAAFVSATTTRSFAVEPADYENYLRGATVGLPLGAAPPPGLYTGLSTLYGVNSFAHGNQALPTPTNFPSLGVGVPILWSTPWNIFGASYSAAAVQGFYVAYSWVTNAGGPPFGPGQSTGISPEIANTSFTPIRLSWNLGQGWFFAGAFSFVAPDGSQAPSISLLAAARSSTPTTGASNRAGRFRTCPRIGPRPRTFCTSSTRLQKGRAAAWEVLSQPRPGKALSLATFCSLMPR